MEISQQLNELTIMWSQRVVITLPHGWLCCWCV